MTYSFKKLLLGNILLLALVSLGLYTAYAIEYGGLGIFPNASEVDEKDPLTKAWFIYTLDRGDVKKGKVNIANTGDMAVDVRLYPVDAVTTADGAFAPEPEDKERFNVGAWVSLDASELHLEPGNTKVVDFTIRVPRDAEVGDHMGAIIVQGKALPKEIEGSGLRIATRVGARMYITVPGKIVKELAFDEFTLQNFAEQNLGGQVHETLKEAITFYATFSNKGNVRIRLKGIIEIRDSSGRAVDVADIPEREVFPQKTITIPIEWRSENLAGEALKARAIVTYGTGQSLVREIAFSIPSLKRPLTLAAVSSSGIAIGIGIGFVISIVLAGLWYFIARRKTGRRHIV